MWLSRIIVLASFLFVSARAATSDDDSIPGRRLIVGTPATPLKHLLGSHNSIRSVERRVSVLRGLLQIRQFFCDPGYSECPSSSGCCPFGGDCCANNKCCDSGQHCCNGGGCCKNTENCVIDNTTGDHGCCPIGESCVKGPDLCDIRSDLPCSNEDFCCPPGNICYRDSDGDPRCRTGSNPPSTTRSVVTHSTTSTKSPSPTKTSTAGPATSTTGPVTSTAGLSSTRTGTLLGHEPTVYPSPPPFSGSQSIVVDATDVQIFWDGPSWTLGPSSCNSTAKSKKTSFARHSLAFKVESATSVYLALSARNVVYNIWMNDDSTTYTETTTIDDCKLTWSSGIITTTTLINVTVEGSATSPLDERRQLPDDWSFEFHYFLMTTPDSATTTGLINPSGLTAPSNAAMSPKAQPVLYPGLVTAFIVFFSFFLNVIL